MTQIACILLSHYYVSAGGKVDVRAAQPLLRVCLNYTENIEIVQPDLVFLDLSNVPGSHLLVPGLAEDITEAAADGAGDFPALGWATRRFVAEMAARRAKARGRGKTSFEIVLPGREWEYLRFIPLRWTKDLPVDTCQRFEQLGIRTWGQLADLSPAQLLAQAGLETGAQLLRRIRGEEELPIRSGKQPLWLEVQRPIARIEEISSTTSVLVRQIAHKLAAGGWAAASLTLELIPMVTVVVRPPAPVPGDQRRLSIHGDELARRLLAQLRSHPPVRLQGCGQLTLRAEELSPVPCEQASLIPLPARRRAGGTNGRDPRLEQLLVWLRQRFGPYAVRRASDIRMDRREAVHRMVQEVYLAK
ncbi:MAG TPA: hypothetical protein GXX55_00850 [Firmicutes bacterium]|nr:hypothetical protein [Bacillota bacterium]